MAMLPEGRWDKPTSVVGVDSVHRRPDPEPVDGHLDYVAEEIVRSHAVKDCPHCHEDTCDLLAWAVAWLAGERLPYPAG